MSTKALTSKCLASATTFLYDEFITDVNWSKTYRPRAQKTHVDVSVAFLLTRVPVLYFTPYLGINLDRR